MRMQNLTRLTVLIVLALSNVACYRNWRDPPNNPSRHCDYVSELALQPCESLVLDETMPIGTAMMVWGLQYKECKLKHEILKSCIEADKPK